MTAIVDDEALLPRVVAAVQSAGWALLGRFSPDARPADAAKLLAAIDANDAAIVDDLRAALKTLRPEAGWIEDEEGHGPLPSGEWWLVDPVEGNVNHIHGMADWGITATLVRDGAAILTVVHVPLPDNTYTAVSNGGAYRDRRRLHVSSKTELAAALVATGQAKPREGHETYQRIAASVGAMLEAALLVRLAVPATFPLLDVAAGHIDLFWQHSRVRAGLLGNALLVTEAGGTVTDLQGRPWTVESDGFLAAAPGVHAAAVAALATTA